jgi:hypothetical protein
VVRIWPLGATDGAFWAKGMSTRSELSLKQGRSARAVFLPPERVYMYVKAGMLVVGVAY